MSIDKNNYELFLMDYLDGKLDANEVSEVLLFLEQNPEIKAEFDGIATINIADLAEVSPSFEHLKQKEFVHIKKEFESLLVTALEGDLTTAESVKLKKGIQLYPELLKEQELFAQTLLKPDYAIIYTEKKSLKRGTVWVLHRNTIMRAAAILLMAFTAGWYLMDNNITTSNPSQPMVSLPAVNQPQPSENLEASTVQPGTGDVSNRTSLSDPKPANQFHKPQRVVANHSHLALIEPIELPVIISKKPEVNTELEGVSQWLAYTQPQLPTKPEDTFTDLRTLAGLGINRGAQKLEATTRNIFEAVNKAAGVSMEKDTTGKVKRFGIKGLGFEWSKSK